MQASDIAELFSVEGKIALVTGGTAGIGRMMAEALVVAGAKVWLVARNADDCARVSEELNAKGDCRAIPGDLSTMAGIQGVAGAFGRAEARIDILINNAGVFAAEPIDEFPEDLWDASLDLNLKAAFFLTQKLLPHLRQGARRGDRARVINIGSGHGIRTAVFESYAYQASKAGLHHLTKVMAQRLAAEGINVNAIAPGVFPSRLTAPFSEATVAAVVGRIPIGRYGDERDIAAAALYLSSRASAFVTAIVLPVDGGFSGIG